ncbi:MAG: lipoyl(octanoyl) transferase LipB [Bacteroidia bacterium]|nr:lipoyl(octanoyl) transferase LipB [Bacteroidia bacterium]
MTEQGSVSVPLAPVVKFRDAGMIDYKEAWDYQESLFSRVVARKTANRDSTTELQITPENFLVLCSHPHVYTLGKSGEENHLLVNGDQLAQLHATFYKINRGGDITYHGPGQIVGYPILDLDQFFTDIHKYLRYLEEVIIRTLADFGITAGRYEGYTGVWLDADHPVKARKICAMGVRTSRWVTMHGWALNVNPDLSYFGNIVPCGINDKAVTSMQKELGTTIDEKKVAERILHHFSEMFSCRIVNDSLE